MYLKEDVFKMYLKEDVLKEDLTHKRSTITSNP